MRRADREEGKRAHTTYVHTGISKEFNLKFLAQSLAVDTQQQDVLSNFHAYNTVLSCVQIIVPIASSGRKYMFVL